MFAGFAVPKWGAGVVLSGVNFVFVFCCTFVNNGGHNT
jgi:hypothetical protein